MGAAALRDKKLETRASAFHHVDITCYCIGKVFRYSKDPKWGCDMVMMESICRWFPKNKKEVNFMRISKSKRRSMVVGLLCIILILASGTYAWQSFSQGAFSPAWADAEEVENNEGGRIHNDFEDREGPGTYDKDIFAENFGDNDLFVRVRLSEFLRFDDDQYGVDGAEIDNPSTWPVYLAEANNVHMRRVGTATEEIGDEGVAWTLGNASDVEKIFMPTFNRATHEADEFGSVPAPFNNAHTYRFSNTTGRGVEAIAGGFVIGDQTTAEDIHDNGIQTGPAISDGTHDFWDDDEAHTATLIYSVINDTNTVELRAQTNVTHYAQPTLSPTPVNAGGVNVTNGIMTVAQWEAANRPTGNFWIMDVDGWFYWNGFLPSATFDSYGDVVSTTATSLLLNGINLPASLGDAWEYVVHVDSDFFTEETMDDLDISAGGQAILDHVLGNND